jgi:hypothetical protein
VSLLVTTDDVALDPDREHVIKYLGYTRPPAPASCASEEAVEIETPTGRPWPLAPSV